MTASIYFKIRRFLKESFFMNPERINLDKMFVRDLGLNSIEFWEVVATLENTYHVNLPDEQLNTSLSIRDLCVLVDEQLNYSMKLKVA